MNMPPEQKVFFVQRKMAFIRFIRLEFFLRPFIEDRIDKSGYSARYFAPVRMHLSLTLPILPDLLLCFAYDQNTDVFQILQQLSDGRFWDAGG